MTTAIYNSRNSFILLNHGKGEVYVLIYNSRNSFILLNSYCGKFSHYIYNSRNSFILLNFADVEEPQGSTIVEILLYYLT